MPKSFIKGFLIVLVVALIGLAPKNKDLIFGYGDTAGQFHKFVCENQTPLKVVLYEPNHPSLSKTTARGEVILNWLKLRENADKYTIAYGVQPGTYIYGLPDVGNINSFTVRYLNPGTRYYFVVRGVNGCQPGPWSQEWSAMAPGGIGGGTVALTQTPKTTITPKTTVTPKTTAPQASPKVIVSPKPGQLPPAGLPQGGVTPPLTFWQRVGNWFGGLFK